MLMPLAEMLPLDVETLRADFPILQTRVRDEMPLVYFDNAATTQRPRAVIDAIVGAYERQYANVHRGIHWLSELSTDLYEGARTAVQRLIHAPHLDEIIFTSGTTASINLVARSWGDANIHAGDEILLTEMEHHSNLVPWQQLAARTGCTLRYLPVTNDGLLDLTALDELLTERTRLVSVVAVSNVLGTINPVKSIITRAHEMGTLVLVDAAQSVPHAVTDVQDLDADFLAFSGHKMMGPSGIGVLYGRQSLLEAMPPFLGGGSMINQVTLEGFTPAGLPEKFEAGTPPIVPAIGLAAAIEYLEGVGLDAVSAHEDGLTRRMHAVLGQFDGVRILGPDPAQKSGIVSFVIDGVQVYDLALMLDDQGIAVRLGHHCALPLHRRLGIPASLRASFYLYNTPEEIDRFAEALESSLRMLRR
jgi:cysteine desulfurase / selenocysteine lyase